MRPAGRAMECFGWLGASILVALVLPCLTQDTDLVLCATQDTSEYNCTAMNVLINGTARNLTLTSQYCMELVGILQEADAYPVDGLDAEFTMVDGVTTVNTTGATVNCPYEYEGTAEPYTGTYPTHVEAGGTYTGNYQEFWGSVAEHIACFIFQEGFFDMFDGTDEPSTGEPYTGTGTFPPDSDAESGTESEGGGNGNGQNGNGQGETGTESEGGENGNGRGDAVTEDPGVTGSDTSDDSTVPGSDTSDNSTGSESHPSDAVTGSGIDTSDDSPASGTGTYDDSSGSGTEASAGSGAEDATGSPNESGEAAESTTAEATSEESGESEEEYNVCGTNNCEPCRQKCVPDPDDATKYRCDCANGYTLSSNSKCELDGSRLCDMTGSTTVQQKVFTLPESIFIEPCEEVMYLRVQPNGMFGFYSGDPTNEPIVSVPPTNCPSGPTSDSILKGHLLPFGAIIDLTQVGDNVKVLEKTADPDLTKLMEDLDLDWLPTWAVIAEWTLTQVGCSASTTIKFQGIVATDWSRVQGFALFNDLDCNWVLPTDTANPYPAAMGKVTKKTQCERESAYDPTLANPCSTIFIGATPTQPDDSCDFKDAGMKMWTLSECSNPYVDCEAWMAGAVDIPADMEIQCGKCPGLEQQMLDTAAEPDSPSPEGYTCYTAELNYSDGGTEMVMERPCCYKQNGNGDGKSIHKQIIINATDGEPLNMCKIKEATAQEYESLASPYNQCCKRGKRCPTKLESKRPVASDTNYKSMKQGASNGDPHIQLMDSTVGSAKYLLFNGKGIFDLLRCDGNSAYGKFVIQAFIDHLGGDTAKPTVFTGFAMNHQPSATATATVEIHKTGTTSAGMACTSAGSPMTIPTTSADYKVVVVPGGWKVLFPADGSAAQVTVTELAADLTALSLTLALDERCKGTADGTTYVTGMMGNFDGVINDADVTARDGTVCTTPIADATEMQYFETLKTWCVSDNAEYLGNTNANNNARCPDYAAPTALLTTCAGDEFCLSEVCKLDFCNTGIQSFAEATVIQQEADAASAAITENTPPAITAGGSVLTWGPSGSSSPTLDLTSVITDVDGQTLTFTLAPECPPAVGLTLAGSTLTWAVPSDITVLTAENLALCGISVDDTVCTTDIPLRIEYCCAASDKGTCTEPVTSDALFVMKAATCNRGWEGPCCRLDQNGCATTGCYAGCTDAPASTIVDASTPVCTCDPCPAGMTGDGLTCSDIDECQTGSANCDQLCDNIFGSYTCSCVEGYTMNSDTGLCEDINECESGGCDPAAPCTNTPGSFSCACPPGFFGSGRMGQGCMDINECTLQTDPRQCGVNAECRNIPGSAVCDCQSGYAKNFSSTDPNAQDNCPINIDNCLPTSDCSQLCMDGLNMYTCACNTGFTLDIADNTSCTATTACTTAPTGCPAGQCAVVSSTDTCVCKASETFVAGTGCQDINECETGAAQCNPATSDCVNIDGGYNCTCKTGYTRGTGNTCDDIDECQCRTDNCDQDCVNNPGSFGCRCRSGYVLSDDGHSCADVNECAVNNGYCDALATCANTAGSYTCTCGAGYSGNGFQCQDVNECENNNFGCQQVCLNTVGSCSCSCRAGYKANADDPKNCDDIDECASSATNICYDNSYCDNTNGGYTCRCPAGFLLTGDQRTCQVDVLCTVKTDCPTTNAPTVPCCNISGTETCLCENGYEYKSGTNKCDDVDECAGSNGAAICLASNKVVCNNTDGGYTCDCINDNYVRLNDEICIDKDECQVLPSMCTGSLCTNTDGGFSCACKSGYTPVGDSTTICQDTNECADPTKNNCNMTIGTCVNTLGSFLCECIAGYQLGADGHTCQDINECQLNSHNCPQPFGICTNTPGSFRCSCQSGFVLDGSICADIDECVSGNNCSQTCEDTAGSYRCTCQTGYTLGSDLETCTATTACAAGAGCQQICAKIGSTDTCGCHNDSYTLNSDGKNCDDVNECTSNNPPCIGGDNVTCNNLAPGFSCSCNNGFTLSADTLSCVNRHGNWTDWSPWSSCPLSCGGYQVNRTRNCTNLTPEGNGLGCRGGDIQYKDGAPWLCPHELQYAASWDFGNLSVTELTAIGGQVSTSVMNAINIECRKKPTKCCTASNANAADLTNSAHTAVNQSGIHRTTSSPRASSKRSSTTTLRLLAYIPQDSDLCVQYAASSGGASGRRRREAPQPTSGEKPIAQQDLIDILNQAETIADINAKVSSAYPGRTLTLSPAVSAEQITVDTDVEEKDDDNRNWVIPVAVVCVLLAVAILIVIIVIVIKKPSKVNDQA